ncbi:hypothetical protein D3C83_121460 [compost metagenome]
MHGAGEDFLAGAGFAGDEDGDVGGGDAADGVEEAVHLVARKERAGFFLDRCCRPQRRAVTFCLGLSLDSHCRGSDPNDVGQR